MHPQPDRGDFVDFYEVLQISPNAEPETVQRVYKMLATRYHPDNPETGDLERFVRLNEAFETLSNPARRREYDATYQSQGLKPIEIFELKEFEIGIDGEANRRMGILCLAYQRRRTSPDHPGLSILELETLMSIPREHLMFTLWYLREKQFVRQDEASDFTITAEGCDYVEKELPANRTLYRLLKAAETGSIHTATSPRD
ncbi:MAG TPA: J domain-containing protein [Bryobacteraceae bacterium]|nr:J domain-containing protein [Bryobacteraceae bacterium]